MLRNTYSQKLFVFWSFSHVLMLIKEKEDFSYIPKMTVNFCQEYLALLGKAEDAGTCILDTWF